ncbi:MULTISPECIES: hypothetical protein [unclassified Lysinibacillus]|uniref:hypothetical protein n=1 Tax=unclassified Lysinibacillus TaxID=2636778 RepID=UPI0010929DD5|nr:MULTISPECIES: hypothetical protein [unclassified Lysinibacillus]TGN33320.1 hypothetical protein E4L99_14790 [Lysinibacillus sp. S2017]
MNKKRILSTVVFLILWTGFIYLFAIKEPISILDLLEAKGNWKDDSVLVTEDILSAQLVNVVSDPQHILIEGTKLETLFGYLALTDIKKSKERLEAIDSTAYIISFDTEQTINAINGTKKMLFKQHDGKTVISLLGVNPSKKHYYYETEDTSFYRFAMDLMK